MTIRIKIIINAEKEVKTIMLFRLAFNCTYVKLVCRSGQWAKKWDNECCVNNTEGSLGHQHYSEQCQVGEAQCVTGN